MDPLSRRSLLGAGAGTAAGLGATTAPAAAREVDPGLVDHWTALLALLDQHVALRGPHDALPALHRELDLIAAHRAAARGRLRTSLQRVEARWAEYASWTSNDAGDEGGRDRCAVRALRLAKEADDHDLVAWLLLWQSNWACGRSEPRQAIAFAQAGLSTTGTTDRMRALCAEQQAYGHALAGDADACRRGLADAHRLRADAGPAPPWDDLTPQNGGAHFELVGDARCMLWLNPAAAIAPYEEAIRIWPADRPRGRGVQQARLALACARAGDPERAAAEGIEALAIAEATGSDEMARELSRLDRRLADCDAPAAAEFRKALAGRGGSAA